ncbi:hypothetical protein SAMN02910456_02165 [Ruminococcaceae bacterium YRB3002]|nr:hypothetical protein SAMN02910456_02165 [Ruminococcaceae bacterium YRB3002]
MNYRVITGEDIDRSYIAKLYKIDCTVYEEKYWGELVNMERRYVRNRKSFVIIEDVPGHPVGYINFLLTNDELWEEIVETGDIIRDDDIAPEELREKFEGEDNNLFIISVVILPDYRGKEAASALTDGFIKYLNKIQKEDDCKIKAISGTAVSEDGQKFLRRLNFRCVREVKDLEEGSAPDLVFVCDGDYLENLLKGKIYIKSYKDDVFLFLPFADNERNLKLKNKLTRDGKDHIPGEDEEPAHSLYEQLDDYLRYEYKNEDAIEELERYYLGKFPVLVTSDTYEFEKVKGLSVPDAEIWEEIGEVEAYMFLQALEVSHLYVLMIYIPNCKYSSSQLEDQLSHGCIKIRHELGVDSKGRHLYKDLTDLLKEKYGLIPCGQGKTILCMNKKPADEQEFINILAAETYMSYRQDFYVNNEILREIAGNDLAVYDYYHVYMTENVVAFILNEYNECTEQERTDYIASYIFIVELMMLQNAAMNKLLIKVDNALANEGDVSYVYISKLYKDYSRIIPFCDIRNFMYYGTQMEAKHIKAAFENDELHAAYNDQQAALEQIVDMTSAEEERRNNAIINIAAIILSVVQIKEFVVLLLNEFYFKINVPGEPGDNTFNVILFGGSIIVIALYFIRRQRRNYNRLSGLGGSGKRRKNRRQGEDDE